MSLDTLDFEEFASLAGRQNLKEVLDGIQAAKEMGLPVKINAVNRKELNPISLVLYAQQQKIPLRFIEIMPVGYGKQYVLYNPKAAGNLALNFAFPFEKILV